MKYLGSVCRGPAYASLLKEKMKHVEKASQAIDDEADLSSHKRLEEIRNISWQSTTHHSIEWIERLKLTNFSSYDPIK